MVVKSGSPRAPAQQLLCDNCRPLQGPKQRLPHPQASGKGWKNRTVQAITVDPAAGKIINVEVCCEVCGVQSGCACSVCSVLADACLLSDASTYVERCSQITQMYVMILQEITSDPVAVDAAVKGIALPF